MFPTSSQLKFWTFAGTTELNKFRSEANQKFTQARLSEDFLSECFLTAAEEKALCRHFEYVLKEFCGRFQPPMPHYVVGTSITYFKRFYLRNSVMDYHPKHIIYTCVYLACKVEEFNVSITQFTNNMRGDSDQNADILLQQELLLMQQLHYHLTIHNCFRPLDGLLIDIKTRCRTVDDAEKLRKGAEEFLDRSLSTDVSLLFAPSQIALAGILNSASKVGLNLDHYVANTLLATDDKANLMKSIEHIKRIRYMVKNMEALNREEIKLIERKLDSCLNQENNPESEEYHRRLEDWEAEEEEESRAHKRRRTTEEFEDEEDESLVL